MNQTLSSLETKRLSLYQQLPSFGDFRSGTISVNFRKCGKIKCVCMQKDHPGHGPRHLWNTTRKGKSLAQHLPSCSELAIVGREIESYKRFKTWVQDVIEVNDDICQIKLVEDASHEDDLASLKKKLRKKSSLKRRKK